MAAQASAWQPNEAGVHQICSLLTEFQKPGTNQAQVRGAGWAGALG